MDVAYAVVMDSFAAVELGEDRFATRPQNGCSAKGFLLCCFQKLKELEKEEELRQKAGIYDSDMSDDDEEMKDKRELARQ